MSATLVIGNYNYSSWSLRAWLAATVSGLRFEVVRLPLDTPEFERRIAEYSPSGRVPVLRDRGRVIWDSLAICEYLAEQFPASELWPVDAGERARARSVAAEMHAGFAALRSQMPMNCRASGRQVPVDNSLRQDISRVERIWGESLAASGGPFLFGHFTIADAMFAPVVFRFETYAVGQTSDSHRYRDHVLGMAASRQWLAKAREESEEIAGDEVGH